MGAPGPLGDFNLQKFFNGPPPSSLPPYTSPSAPYAPGSQQQAGGSHPLSFNTFPAGNTFPGTYPFNSQQPPQPGMQNPGMQMPGMYNPYIHYPQDHGHRPPPYPNTSYPNVPTFPTQGPPPQGTFTQPQFPSSASQASSFMQPPPSTQTASAPQAHVNMQSSAPATSVASLVQAPEPVASPPLDGAHLMALLTTQSSAETSKEDSNSPFMSTPNLLDLPPSVMSSDATQNNVPEVSLPPPAISPALPTAPPINLAPPNSRAPGTKPISKGRYLKGEHIVYDIDERLQYEAQPQLEVTPITVYGSESVLVLGRQIAVNRTYICYGLKQGTIRILNINTALRVLLRGHSQRVTDMVFFSEDVHLLASASTDGRIFVRRVSEGTSDDQRVIKDQIILAIQMVGDWKSAHPRVCWHSENQDILLVGIGKYVLYIDTAKARANAPTGGFTAEDPVKCHVSKPLEGVHVYGEHSNDITDLSVTHWSPFCVASASLDGTVRIWQDKKSPIALLIPYQGQPVNSVSFLSAPSRPDQAVLVTAGPLNREVKLYAHSPLDGPPGKPGSGNWRCIQTLEIKSSAAEGRQDTAFFNQAVVVPTASLVILANFHKKAIYVVHLEFGLTAAATQMDYLAEFSVTMPILSLTATGESASHSEDTVQVYCVQTQAIQQYALELSQCVPTPEDVSHGRSLQEPHMITKEDEQSFFPEASDYPNLMNELTSVSTSVSTVTASTVVNPTGISRGSNLGMSSERTTTYEQNIISSKTLDPRATMSHRATETDASESIDALSSLSSIARYGEPPSAPPHDALPNTPAHMSAFLSSKPRPPQGESPNSVEDGYVLVPTDSGVPSEQPEVTSAKEQPPLESRVEEMNLGPSLDQTSTLGRDFEKEDEPLLTVHSSASEPTISIQQQSGAASSYLLSPTELMNMVARSKASESGVNSSPNLPSAVTDSNKAQAITDEAIAAPEADMLMGDTPVPDSDVPQASSLIEKDDGGFDEKSSLLMDPKESNSLEYSTKDFNWDGSSSVNNFVETNPADDIHRAEDADGLDEREFLPSSTAEDLAEHVKDVGSRTGETVSVSAAPTQSAAVTKGRKNKNKTNASPAVASIPLPVPSQIPVSTGNSTFEGEGSTSASVPLVDIGVVYQIATLQESVNQLVTMQKDLQKQMSVMVAAPIAKETKRIEASLGLRTEKIMKAHMDALVARIQEEVAKREKQERERMQQLNTAISNSTKDMPVMLERIFKKETAAMGPSIVRAVSSNLEKISISAITDTIQKSLVEKVLPQLDKTVATKLETVLSRQVQAQLQAALKPALQDAVRTAVETTVIPGFESSCRAMFEQMDGALQRGIAEHTISAHQQFEASHSTLAANLQESVVSASSLANSMKGELTEGVRRIINLAESANANANVNVRANPTSVKQGNSGLPDQAVSLQHVEESLDPTIELTRLVNEGKLEEAFHKALSIGDVTIVSWLCRQVDLKSLFSTTPLPLSQGVLLSMIQQLGSDLDRDIGLKLEWIKETALALNPKDPLLAPHMRLFLEQLYANLHRQSHHLAAGGELANSMRLVLHLVNSLLTACK